MTPRQCYRAFYAGLRHKKSGSLDERFRGCSGVNILYPERFAEWILNAFTEDVWDEALEAAHLTMEIRTTCCL